MNSDKRMDFGRQFKILREVLLALQLVHEQGCVHLDIKPENIFVKDNMFKLGDFGTATLRDEINAKTGKAMDVEEGDSRYMPRDLLEGTPEDLTKCDIFSLGITLYETCVGCPLPHCGQDWQDLRDGKLSKPLDINPTLYLIIKQMMHPDPSKRPTASDLLARSELSVNSDDVFLSSTNTISSKSTRPFPLNKRKRSFSF
jgi:serine/threonine protein kinase